MSDSDSHQEPELESRRVPLEREVVLEFEHFSSFIREYSANISLGGMFIKSDRPHPPDSVFRFEVRLADEALIAGRARVLWVREAAEGADRPSGMGVRFLELEPEGRDLIEQIVREHVARGGQPFRIEEAVEAAVGSEKPSAETTPSVKPPPSDERSSVIELPPLEDLLEEARSSSSTQTEARSSSSTQTLETPPRGWKPGISAARPQTRPQLIATIAVAAAIAGAVIFFLVRMFGSAPVVDQNETEPVALPRAEEAAEEPLPPFTGVEEVSWRRLGSRAEVVVRLDGSLPDGSWALERISDPPRQLLRLIGASRPYPAETFEVGHGGVRQLRTGYYDGGAGNEQHVVIDLVDPRVALEESLIEGSTVRLRFRRLS